MTQIQNKYGLSTQDSEEHHEPEVLALLEKIRDSKPAIIRAIPPFG